MSSTNESAAEMTIDEMRKQAKIAYAYLWHVMPDDQTGPGSTIVDPYVAADRARVALRDLLTLEDRRDALDGLRATPAFAEVARITL